LTSAFNKYSGKRNADELLQKKFNKTNDTLLLIKDGRWLKGDNLDIDNIEWKVGPHSFRKDGFPSVIVIKELLEPSPKSYKEVQAVVMTGYQDFLESEWIGQLNKKYSVKIDNLVLEEVMRKLHNE
jgi:peptidyl-prolyl cis-trans isomerase SurA